MKKNLLVKNEENKNGFNHLKIPQKNQTAKLSHMRATILEDFDFNFTNITSNIEEHNDDDLKAFNIIR